MRTIATTVAAGVFISSLLGAQLQPADVTNPTFDVVSVKLNKSGAGGGSIGSQPGGSPVFDRTGLSGYYAFTLEFTLGNDGVSIFTALQEQLGLKLEPTRGPVDILVIDRIERPTEN